MSVLEPGFPDTENVSLPGSSTHLWSILLLSIYVYIDISSISLYIYMMEMATHSSILAWKIP